MSEIRNYGANYHATAVYFRNGVANDNLCWDEKGHALAVLVGYGLSMVEIKSVSRC